MSINKQPQHDAHVQGYRNHIMNVCQDYAIELMLDASRIGRVPPPGAEFVPPQYSEHILHYWDSYFGRVDDGTGGPDDNDNHVWAYHNRDEDHHECDSDECCKVDDDDTFDALFVVWAYMPGSVRNKGFDCPASARLERDMLMAAGVYAEIEDCTINPYGG